ELIGRGRALHGSGVPVGVFGEPGTRGPALALRRPALLAAGDHRPGRARRGLRRARLRPARLRARAPELPSLRDAAGAAGTVAADGYVTRVPRRGGHAPAASRPRARRPARA